MGIFSVFLQILSQFFVAETIGKAAAFTFAHSFCYTLSYEASLEVCANERVG